jgi:hypothetical protein
LAAWARGEAREALLGVWRTLDAVWVNHPDRNRVAESKLSQLRVAPELGFEAPDTLVSNQADVDVFLDGIAKAVQVAGLEGIDGAPV